MSTARESYSPAPPERSMSRRRSLGAEAAADQIKVICRFRPPALPQPGAKNQMRPKKDINESSFKLNEENSSIEFTSDFYETKSFTFDKVFGMNCTQLEVFNTVSGVVDSVMGGFNGTVMAYGQTSAGKSYTMEGPSLWDEQSQGIMPRCIDKLFEQIENSNESIQFQLLISYYEVYCEKVRDLLNPSSINLKIRETKADGFVVQDITEVSCTNRGEVLRIIELGKANRASAPTLMNAESSRSHSIISILVDQQDIKTGRQRRGSLFLVDLAGSEKVSKTGAKGLRLEEAKNINSSLTTLGMVINSLCDGLPHIPYRDSKLTQLLMEALGGNSRTTLIICCTPESRHTPETLSTLRFGERAKRIKNNAKINEELSPDELKVMLQSARKEVVVLKRRIKKFTTIMVTSLAEENLSSLHEQLNNLQALVNDVEVADVSGVGGDGTSTAAGIATLTPSTSMRRMESFESDVRPLDSSSLKDNDLLIGSGGNESFSQSVTNELADLNSKIKQLEDELETEKERYIEEHQNLLDISAESIALKATIKELEDKLLQNTLQAKRSMMWNNNEFSATGSSTNGKSGLTSLEHSPDQRSVRAHSLSRHSSILPPEAPAIAGRTQSGSFTAGSTHQVVAMQDSVLGAPIATSGDEVEEVSNVDDVSLVIEGKKPEFSESEEVQSTKELRTHSTQMTVEELESLGFALRSELEEDLQILTEGFNEKSAEAKHANDVARSYAERYIKLREDYETHVQRLMLKVTQEQQTRIQLEDRLEEALHDAAYVPKKSNKYFFSGWFSRTGSEQGRRHSISYQGNGNSMGFDSPESPGMTALEMAQFRIAQLSSELEANKEAQNIVLDTKESVMRSLARQNTELTLEKDALNAKVEELTTKVDQMTSLIRSFQQQQAQSIMNSSSAGNVSRSGSGYGRAEMLQQPPRTGGVLGVGGHNSRVRSITLTPRAANIIRSGGAFKFGISTHISGGQSHDGAEEDEQGDSPLPRAVHRITPIASLTSASAELFPQVEDNTTSDANNGASTNASSNVSRNSSKQEMCTADPEDV